MALRLEDGELDPTPEAEH